jgi:hypothetical protein
MIKGRFLPFTLFLAIFLGFAIIPLIKISFELFQLQRSLSNVTRFIGSDQVNINKLNAEFSKIGSSGLKLDQEFDYPLWSFIAGLTGNAETFTKIQTHLPDAAWLAPSFPELLGFNQPKTYMLVFQNSAEARGTGGIIGAYAVVTVNRATFTVDRVGSNIDLQHMSRMPIEISSDFYLTYGDDPAIWQNSNMSPHFPYGARIWSALWKNQTGVELDGVLAVDPLVLKAILGVTGSLRLDDGSLISFENVVSETLSDVYKRFDGRNTQRKSYLVEIARKTLTILQSGGYSKLELGRALIKPYQEHRILFYSSDLKTQSALERTLLGGSLDRGGKDYRLVIQNIAGNKMDYYLERGLEIEVLQCGMQGKTRVKATVTNQVSELKPLPTYVMGRLDLGKPEGNNNSHAISVFLYGPKGSELLSSKVTGYPQDASFSGYERGRSFYSAPVELDAGETVVVEAEFEGGFADISTSVQPLVVQQETRISNGCG